MAELEIAINKRILERAAFSLIIVALLIYILVDSLGEEPVLLQANMTYLEEQHQVDTARIATLERELQEARVAVQEAEQRKQPPQPEPEAQPVQTQAAPALTLSGATTYDWDVDGQLMIPSEYNAAQITALQVQLAQYEAEHAEASDTKQDVLEDKMDDIEAEIRELQRGDPKYKVNNVTITISNGKPTDAAYDYILCWPSIDCINVRSMGSINVPSGATVNEQVRLTIPTLVAVSGRTQVLRLSIKQENTEVFKEDHKITLPQ